MSRHQFNSILRVFVLFLFAMHLVAQNPPSHSSCSVHATKFEGWTAQQMTNDWLQLTFVPQLGGRLMQAVFDGHPYLFVNPKYKGKYISPIEAAGSWINYGGDKIWPMPEGENDEQHWVLQSSPLDDGTYSATPLVENSRCSVKLDGPPDPQTGLQYSRTITIRSDSPEITFHAVMKNISGHSIEWSVQSVTQYDLSDPKSPGEFNKDFWAFTPVNPRSAYLDGFHVRSGLSDDPSLEVSDGLFRLHWRYLENEVWVDSSEGWLAVVDNTSGYAMVERFDYQEKAEYPGKATVIFYKNGPSVTLDESLRPRLTSANPADRPYYMEAELNSPIVRLKPGESYTMETRWFPTRAVRNLKAVADAGIIGVQLIASTKINAAETASAQPNSSAKSDTTISLSGIFGVFFSGRLQARLYDDRGVVASEVVLQTVRPQELVNLHAEIKAPPKTTRLSLHLIDDLGLDRGSLGEVPVNTKQ